MKGTLAAFRIQTWSDGWANILPRPINPWFVKYRQRSCDTEPKALSKSPDLSSMLSKTSADGYIGSGFSTVMYLLPKYSRHLMSSNDGVSGCVSLVAARVFKVPQACISTISMTPDLSNCP